MLFRTLILCETHIVLVSVIILSFCNGDAVWNQNYDPMSEREMEYLVMKQQQDVNILKVDTKWLKYMIGELKNKSGGLDSAVHRISRSATQMLRENKQLADKINNIEQAVATSNFKPDSNFENELFKKNNRFYYTKHDKILPSDLLQPKTALNKNSRKSSPYRGQYVDKYAHLHRPAGDQPMFNEKPLATVVEKGVIKLADIPSPTEKEHTRQISHLQSSVKVVNSTCVAIKGGLEKQQEVIDETSMNVELLKDKSLAMMQRIQRLEQGFEDVRKEMRAERNKNKSKMRRLEKRLDEIDHVIYSVLTKIKQ